MHRARREPLDRIGHPHTQVKGARIGPADGEGHVVEQIVRHIAGFVRSLVPV